MIMANAIGLPLLLIQPVDESKGAHILGAG